jgi:hypothetical protein
MSSTALSIPKSTRENNQTVCMQTITRVIDSTVCIPTTTRVIDTIVCISPSATEIGTTAGTTPITPGTCTIGIFFILFFICNL